MDSDRVVDITTDQYNMQFVLFTISNEHFGASISEVKEISPLTSITPVPHAPEYIAGIADLRGKIVVVVNLAKRIGLQHRKPTRLLITDVGRSTVGFLVDSCNEVIKVQGDEIEPTPEVIKERLQDHYLEGVVHLNNKLVILVKLSAVLEEENILMEELTKQHESKESEAVAVVEPPRS